MFKWIKEYFSCSHEFVVLEEQPFYKNGVLRLHQCKKCAKLKSSLEVLNDQTTKPERLEEIRELNEKLAEMYGDSSSDRPVIRQLLDHINALEEELYILSTQGFTHVFSETEKELAKLHKMIGHR